MSKQSTTADNAKKAATTTTSSPREASTVDVEHAADTTVNTDDGVNENDHDVNDPITTTATDDPDDDPADDPVVDDADADQSDVPPPPPPPPAANTTANKAGKSRRTTTSTKVPRQREDESPSSSITSRSRTRAGRKNYSSSSPTYNSSKTPIMDSDNDVIMLDSDDELNHDKGYAKVKKRYENIAGHILQKSKLDDSYVSQEEINAKIKPGRTQEILTAARCQRQRITDFFKTKHVSLSTFWHEIKVRNPNINTEVLLKPNHHYQQIRMNYTDMDCTLQSPEEAVLFLNIFRREIEDGIRTCVNDEEVRSAPNLEAMLRTLDLTNMVQLQETIKKLIETYITKKHQATNSIEVEKIIQNGFGRSDEISTFLTELNKGNGFTEWLTELKGRATTDSVLYKLLAHEYIIYSKTRVAEYNRFRGELNSHPEWSTQFYPRLVTWIKPNNQHNKNKKGNKENKKPTTETSTSSSSSTTSNNNNNKNNNNNNTRYNRRGNEN